MIPGKVDEFKELIENYEELVKDLHQEIFTIKNQHEELKSNLTSVIAENKILSGKLNESLQNLHRAEPKKNNYDDDLSENLRAQIFTLSNEKDCVTKLWQESVKTIDHLEDEIKVFQAGYQGFVPKKEHQKIKASYEEKIHDLEIKLSSTQKNLENTVQDAKSKIEIKYEEVDKSLENQTSAMKIIKNLETEVLKLQKRLQEIFEEKLRLEKLLDNKEDSIQNLKKSNADCINRITEAVSIVEAALNEKDAALFRENQLSEENHKLVEEMTKIVNECQAKIKSENHVIKSEFNLRQKNLLQEIEKAHDGIKNKNGEIESLNKKNALLENEIERMHKGHCSIEENEINKLLVLEKNLESTFQKLLKSEKQNIQLVSEKELIKNDLDQMAGLYDRNLKAKEIEIVTLKSKTTRLEDELRESYFQIDQISERMVKLNDEIAHTEKLFLNEKENYEKNLQDRTEQITKKYNDNLKELQLQLEKKNEIHQKWRNESKILTDNLEKMVTTLKQDLKTLKNKNKHLKESLKKSEQKVKQYKSFLDLVSKDVAKISNLTVQNSVNS